MCAYMFYHGGLGGRLLFLIIVRFPAAFIFYFLFLARHYKFSNPVTFFNTPSYHGYYTIFIYGNGIKYYTERESTTFPLTKKSFPSTVVQQINVRILLILGIINIIDNIISRQIITKYYLIYNTKKILYY